MSSSNPPPTPPEQLTPDEDDTQPLEPYPEISYNTNSNQHQPSPQSLQPISDRSSDEFEVPEFDEGRNFDQDEIFNSFFNSADNDVQDAATSANTSISTDMPSQEFRSLVEPFGPLPSAAVDAATGNSLNTLMSYTPIERTRTPRSDWLQNDDDLSKELTKRLGSKQHLGNIETTELHTNFLRHCCEACIYQGQGQSIQKERAIAHAVHGFNAIIKRQPDCSLTTLNNMVFLLDQYGHMDLAQYILFRVDSVGPERLPHNIISETIRFKRSIPEPGQRPSYDILSLRSVVEKVEKFSTKDSHLVLTAKYNLAWALLEMKEPGEALSMLRDLRIACERVFGRYQFQTIMCVATLARAYLMEDEANAVSAELLIDEVVAPRVEKVFSPSHPFYHESKNRQALFKLKLASLNVEPTKTELYWAEGERLLRDVLIWRGNELGMVNPQTQRTLRVLKYWLKERGRVDVAEGLMDWIRDRLV